MGETHLLAFDESIDFWRGLMSRYPHVDTLVGLTKALNFGLGRSSEREFSLTVALSSDGFNAHSTVLYRLGVAVVPIVGEHFAAMGVGGDVSVGFGRDVYVTPCGHVVGGACFLVVFTVFTCRVPRFLRGKQRP